MKVARRGFFEFKWKKISALLKTNEA